MVVSGIPDTNETSHIIRLQIARKKTFVENQHIFFQKSLNESTPFDWLVFELSVLTFLFQNEGE